MISTKLGISQVLARIPECVRKQDFILNTIRSFSVTSVLDGRRINTRRPRPPCYERALINEICKVKYAPNLEYLKPLNQRCDKIKTEQRKIEKQGLNEENQYEKFLAQEVFDIFHKNKMVAIVHRQSMLTETLHEIKLTLKRAGMKYTHEYGRHTIALGLDNTKYSSIMPLFKVSEAIIYSPENKVGALLKVLKKSPQLILMAVIVDGQLLSKTETEMFAATNLATQQAALVHTISSVANTLTSHLNHHASTLVSRLDQHVSAQKESDESSPAESQPPTTENGDETKPESSS